MRKRPMPNFLHYPQHGKRFTHNDRDVQRPPLNLQRHAKVKAKRLFQQESCTEQFSIGMWPPHELKPNGQPILG
jgi:hypothetical protein